MDQKVQSMMMIIIMKYRWEDNTKMHLKSGVEQIQLVQDNIWLQLVNRVMNLRLNIRQLTSQQFLKKYAPQNYLISYVWSEMMHEVLKLPYCV